MIHRVCVTGILTVAVVLAAMAQQSAEAAYKDQLQKASALLRARKYDEAIKEFSGCQDGGR